MDGLEILLERAARSADWEHAIVHRCAWCKRVLMPDGEYRDARPLDLTMIATDGMCASCAAIEQAKLVQRRTLRAA